MRMFFDRFKYDVNSFWSQWRFRFDGDAGDGGGSGGEGKEGEGKEGEGKEGEGEKEAQTFTIKDGSGTEKIVTLAEMQEMATKAAGADEKFRVAAEKLKEATEKDTSGAKATKIVELHDKLYVKGDFTKSDIREFGEMVGMEEGEMEKLFEEELKKQGKSAGADVDKTPFHKLKMDDMDPEVQEILKQAYQGQVVDAEKKIEEMVKKAVDKDEFFGTILKKTDDKQRDDRKAAINEMVKKDVNRRILQSKYTKEVFGDPMIQGSVQEIRANIKRFGITDKTSKQPVSSALAGLGLPGDLQTKIQADEKIERVPVTDDNWLDNVVARLAQDQNVK